MPEIHVCGWTMRMNGTNHKGTTPAPREKGTFIFGVHTDPKHAELSKRFPIWPCVHILVRVLPVWWCALRNRGTNMDFSFLVHLWSRLLCPLEVDICMKRPFKGLAMCYKSSEVFALHSQRKVQSGVTPVPPWCVHSLDKYAQHVWGTVQDLNGTMVLSQEWKVPLGTFPRTPLVLLTWIMSQEWFI